MCSFSLIKTSAHSSISLCFHKGLNRVLNMIIWAICMSSLALHVMSYQVARIPNGVGKAKFNLHNSDSFLCLLLNSSYRESYAQTNHYFNQ